MHWVDRGPEPEGLGIIRSQYTPRWVEHYRYGSVPRPSDSRWRDFRADLSRTFFSLCAYCEEIDRGEVDHFRPKSKFPELVYEWSNWVFSCHFCNMSKLEKWPPRGYVNPCAKSRSARPENFFDFDTRTGEIEPRPGLSPERRRKAMAMIDELRLNELHHRQKRLGRIAIISTILSQESNIVELFKIRLHEYTDRSTELSSVSRFVVTQLGSTVESSISSYRPNGSAK